MRFLFGKPVEPVKPRAGGQRRLFVLGAYPSALHVKWQPPGVRRPVRAVAVDNEPEPFWNGTDELERIERWKKDVEFRSEWGQVGGCGSLNGSSGDWVMKNVLCPLECTYNEAWITDCLNTYFESTGAAKRMDSKEIRGAVDSLGIPPRSHSPHPSESQIVQLAVDGQLERLNKELATARPEIIVTLGNAALHVLRQIALFGDASIMKLRADSTYGAAIQIEIQGNLCLWVPLAHPAAPKIYQERHRQWVNKQHVNT